MENTNKDHNRAVSLYYVEVDFDGVVDYLDITAYGKKDATLLARGSGYKVIRVLTESEFWAQESPHFDEQQKEAV